MSFCIHFLYYFKQKPNTHAVVECCEKRTTAIESVGVLFILNEYLNIFEEAKNYNKTTTKRLNCNYPTQLITESIMNKVSQSKCVKTTGSINGRSFIRTTFFSKFQLRKRPDLKKLVSLHDSHETTAAA